VFTFDMLSEERGRRKRIKYSQIHLLSIHKPYIERKTLYQKISCFPSEVKLKNMLYLWPFFMLYVNVRKGLTPYDQGGFTKGERTLSLLYIFNIILVQCTSMEIFQWSVAPLVFKIWHSPRTGREKRSEGGVEKEGMSRGVECQYS
jgi:hypothetical protein